MSEFLRALGSESVTVLWLPLAVWTGICLIVLLALARLLHRQHSRLHVDVLTALVAALPLAMLVRLVPWGGNGAPISMAFIPRILPEMPALAGVGSGTPSAVDPALWIGMATLMAMLVSATGIIRVMSDAWRLHGILRRAENASEEKTRRMVRAVQEYLGATTSVRVLISREIYVPFSAGFFRPVVVLPESTTRIDVVLHEMIHHHHGDLRRSWLVEIVTAVFLFHPLLYVISRQVRLHVEMLCDARVLMHPDVEPKSYAELLLRVTRNSGRFRLAGLPMADSLSPLHERIKAMESRRVTGVPSAIARSVSLAIFACSVLLVSCTETDAMLTEADGPHLAVEDQTTYIVVEENPGVIGGLEGLQARVVYPPLARKARVEGRVYVQLVVNLDGRAEDIVITRGIGAGCDEAAVEAIRNTRFTPGKQGGKPVRVKMSLPVNFKLSGPESGRTAAPGPPVASSREVLEIEDSGIRSSASADPPPWPTH